MNLPESFQINHKELEPGIYRKKQMMPGGILLYKVDIRVCEPYKEPVIPIMELHSIEHILATYLGELSCNFTDWLPKVDFSVFGCRTGFQWITYRDPKSPCRLDADTVGRQIIRAIAMWDGLEIPGGKPEQCGNAGTLAKTPDELAKVKAWLLRIVQLAEDLCERKEFAVYPMIKEEF